MEVGICGWGAYIPQFRIAVEQIARVWGKDPEDIKNSLGIEAKSVPNLDEDTITISVEAAKQALARAEISPEQIGAIYIGSESKPYAVKPSGTVVAEAIGTGTNVNIVDTEFACKAGTTCIWLAAGLVAAGFIKYGLAIGADCAQSKPGDALEYTAAAGGAAFIIGQNPVASLDAWHFYTTDTPDFWRREGRDYPSHGARFTGKPAYFKHIIGATQGILAKTGLKPADFDYVVFHMPNGKFPLTAAKQLGFTYEQIKPGFIVPKIGNCYSGSSPLGLAAVLDIAKPGQKILLTSYGSGAGSDSFIFTVKDGIERKQNGKPVRWWIERGKFIDYATYVRIRGKLKV
jgi:hydroxymethylglutaryl-CoA synthase